MRRSLVFHIYTLALIVGVLLIVGAPLHQLGTRHANVVRVDPVAQRVAVRAVDAVGLAPGDRLPVYRFNPSWKREIGHAVVDEVGEEQVWARYDAAAMSWPMGRQGRVSSEHDDAVTLDFGENLGVTVGQTIRVFRERTEVALLRVEQVNADWADARVTRRLEDSTEPLTGLVAAEFNIPTQLSWFAGGWRTLLELIAIAGTLGVWLWSVFSPVPGQRFAAAVQAGRSLVGRVGPTGGAYGIALLGVPVVWAGSRLLWYGSTHALWSALGWLRWLGVPVPFEVSQFPDTGLNTATVLLALAWYGTLVWTGGHPGRMLWDALYYRVPDLTWVPGLRRGQVNWFLHLPIFYAFASTLHIFTLGNLQVIAFTGWRSAELNVRADGGLVRALVHMATHLPQFATASEAYECANHVLLTVCILGCLVGYGHTMLTGLFTDSIRNVDFTILGWFTTAICYGPLLGVVVWRFMPELSGSDPILTDGPWFWFMMGTALLLNLLYTLAILNFGKRFGVMVDKGLVDWGFYSVVRHPAYTLESLLFVAMGMVGFTTLGPWFGASVFIIQYYFRSEREDDFMKASNPDYVEYRERVVWKYIPGVW
ncbi:MAG: protein-S-isoprenylcysteine O-methyltransferase Ste14 [Myxococcota bacterium]|jgi:protein-S-isoprenylcysteine O-methyltransferase Ste14